MSIIEKINQSRQTVVEVAGKKFTIARPTPMQAMDWLVGIGGDPLSADDVKKFIAERFSLHNQTWRKLAQSAIERFVVDWPGMQELDIVPGGDGSLIPFNRDVFLVWVQDYPETITNLAYKIFEAWNNYLGAQQETEKKPESGTSPDT
jgi:hypothetical protein